MNFLIILFTISILFNPSTAQEDNSPLIPARKSSPHNENDVDYIGIKDPFAPKTVTTKTPATPTSTPGTEKPHEVAEDSSKDLLEEQKPVKNFPLATSEPAPNDNLEQLTEEPKKETHDSWEEELLYGKDEDFKPAPLKLETDSIESQETNPVSTTDAQATPNPTSSPTVDFVLPGEESQEGKDLPQSSPAPLPTPTKTPIPQERTKEQIKPADLITEEIDPWDDPRKKVSTTCRLQLERIKKKKIMLDRADGTTMRLQESLKQKNGDLQKIQQLSDKLEYKINDLKKEIQYLKEKAVRQGCPGVYF